jgi:hypothetical protein
MRPVSDAIENREWRKEPEEMGNVENTTSNAEKKDNHQSEDHE